MKIYVMLVGDNSDVMMTKDKLKSLSDGNPNVIVMYKMWDGDFDCVAYDTIDVGRFMLSIGMNPKIVLFNSITNITDLEIMLDIFTEDELELVLVGDVESALHLNMISMAMDCGVNITECETSGMWI